MPGRRKDAPQITVPECNYCSMPRPHTREEWASYQGIILSHLRSLNTPTEVRAHDTARRHFLGEPPEIIEANVRAQLDWWDTAKMLDNLTARPPVEGSPRAASEAMATMTGRETDAE